MLESEVDPSLLLFRRQYMQLFESDFLAWPPQKLLRTGDAQAWLYKTLFNDNQNLPLPPKNYQARVLNMLIPKIERAIEYSNEEGRECYSCYY